MRPENFRNSRAWRTAFWPTVASRTSRDLDAGARDLAGDDPPDLLQLVHQVGVGVDAAGRVDEEDVALAGP